MEVNSDVLAPYPLSKAWTSLLLMGRLPCAAKEGEAMTLLAYVCETSSQDRTTYRSEADWKGKKVWVDSSYPPCPVHELHADEGFLLCPACGGVAVEPEPFECNRATGGVKR